MLNPLSLRSSQSSVSAEFSRALTLEIMRSERQRIVVLLATLLVLLTLIAFALVFLPREVETLFHGQMSLRFPLAVMLPLALYELVALRVITLRMRKRTDIPVLARYVSAFVETSLPSIALFIDIPMMGSSVALGFVGPMIYFLFIILSTLRLDFKLSFFTGLVAGTELLAIVLWQGAPTGEFDSSIVSLWYQGARCLILVIGGFLAGIVGARLRRQFEASIAAATARDRITNLFGQHVSPQVVERLLTAGPDLSHDTRQVAVMFVDIRGFTAAARERTPQEVVERLDGAFAVLVEIVDRNGGIVNKFLGDGFLALFGAPLEDTSAAQHAVTAAHEMLDAMTVNNADSDWPLRIGIGLHLGSVVAGNVGSPRRKEYTVIGDTVNFASRIESLNKQFGSQILISAAVHSALGADAHEAVPLGEVPIRGYDHAMALWKLA
jgi:adenylate cyclase